MAFFCIYSTLNASLELQKVTLGKTSFQVEVADKPELWQKGLMNRAFLPKHRGMLFKFKEDAIHRFWMKNTLISLDMLWINHKNKIVYIKKEAQPLDETSIEPTEKARYVLEIRGGLAEEYNINIGDEALFVPTLNKH